MASNPMHSTTKPKPIPLVINKDKDYNPEMDREFIAWDGEGIDFGGTEQNYVLFGASTGHRIQNHNLSSVQCLDLLLQVASEHPKAIHVGFSISYDINMIVRNLPVKQLNTLFDGGWVKWKGYAIHYLEGKWFQVSKGAKGKRVTCRLFDVWGFFQSSFVVACRQYLGEAGSIIEKGKRARSSFQWSDLSTEIVPYWEQELAMLVSIMGLLRGYLDEAGFPIRSWHGPGAIANAIFNKHHIERAMANVPEEVAAASRMAYAGGRFEQFKAGHYNGKVWEYDINSAYPNVIRKLPNLSRGNWVYSAEFRPGTFGVWEIDYCGGTDNGNALLGKHPFFCRDARGSISFPPNVQTWAWTPEAELSPESVRGGWVFEEENPLDRPFAFIEEYYQRRREWKLNGNPAQLAYKLGLNSLYGKMAQRAGWTQENQRIPKWHQLEWAGYVTSATRSMLWNVQNLASAKPIVAMETDAIFSTEPLPLDIGSNLGEWEVTCFDNLTYIQSGFYYGETEGKLVEKYRGFDKGSLPREKVLSYLRHMDHRRMDKKVPRTKLVAPTTRFIRYKAARKTSASWRSWRHEPREIIVGEGGKRHHSSFCPECKTGLGLANGFHSLSIPGTLGGVSAPHPLPWESFLENAGILEQVPVD